MPSSVQDSINHLTNSFAQSFPLQREGARKIGREAEYPLVDQNGNAADVRQVLIALSKNPAYQPKYEGPLLVELVGENHSYSLEVGWGTMEIIGGACQHLFEMEGIHLRAFEELYQAASQLGFNILGYGAQPVTPASLELMSPKSRYDILHKVIGDPWLWFTTTASEQVHVEISRSEVAPMLNLGNLLSPAVIALCGNSPIFGGKDSPYCSGREGAMGEIFQQAARHGMTHRPMRDIQDWVESICGHRFLVSKQQGQYSPEEGLFSEYLNRNGANFEDFLVHEHYLWNSARPRTAHGTIEIRPACQQPFREHMAAATLGVGLVEAGAEIQAWINQQLGEDAWKVMQEYHHQAISNGLAAVEPFQGFLKGILDRMEDGLKRRGFGEETFLNPLYRRLEKQENPAQEARRIYRTQGMDALLKSLRCSI